MSLLMEALRKAEQVKKQAAEGGRPPEPGVHVGTTDVPGTATPSAASGKETAEPPSASLFANEPLTIETHIEETAPLEEPRVVLEGWEVSENEGDITPVQEPVISLPQPEERQVMESTDAPSIERPVMESTAVPSAEKLVMESTVVPSATIISPAEVSPPVAIAGHKSPSGSTGASRQAAQTVFLAKSRHKRRSFRLRVFCYGLLLVTGILGAAVYLYMSAQNVPMPFQPVQAVNVPPPPVEPIEPQPKQVNVEGLQPVAVPVNLGRQDSQERGDDAQPSSSPGVLSATPAASGRPGTLLPEVARPATVVAASAPLVGVDLSGGERFEPAPLAVSGLEAIAPQSITITKRSATPQNDALLTAANGAFEMGQYQQSRSRYQQILKAEPDHRGALLGLAALAVRGQDSDLARDLYLRLLTRDPSDPLAKAGLLSVMAGGDPVRLESELKLILEVHPDLAPPLFLLGNLYAAGQRWSEAQQAYFNAVQAAAKSGAPSPDYCFNLAVSLEHMGQLSSAIRYYREAISLAESRPAGFDREGLKGRMEIIDPGVGK
ncbi:MAG: tetratricopeptide repeat protein [Proteobacteria bacterium]|nr:tetratricopeptide repeat protein [Pseudomonadota bacterium]